MEHPLALGVDLGGTKIAFVLIDEQGNVLANHQRLTGVPDGPDAIVERMATGIHSLLEQAHQPVAGIGIGSPGHLNPVTGTVHSATNLGWCDVPLVEGLRQRLSIDLPIWLQKDTNAAVLGETYYGAARGCKDVVLVAVGTGLGVGAIVDGRILLGANVHASDIGHLALDPSGRLCTCGLRGCAETYISGNGLVAGVREHRAYYPESPLAQQAAPSTAAILQAARQGDPLAQLVLGEAADWLGKIFIYCGVILNPALFVVSGGLGLAAADLLLERAEREFRRNVLPPISEKIQIVRSEVTDSAIGAACLVWDALRQDD
jgi:glucokinase